ncbi:YncE family protein [Amycolatopsis anabasis]|uniref:YncE family protein n=1 Tax=Amycolatopsis anabasis TaxID=1840409 RepID=UPI00131EBE7D|nr:YncE family protein [Amycolatopsis anabasis]
MTHSLVPRRTGLLVAAGISAALVGLGAAQAAAATGPSVGAPIPAGNSPFEIAALPALHKVFVAENGDHTVGVFDTEKGEFTQRIPLPGKQPLSVAANRKTGTVYVGTYQDTLEVIDGARGTVKASYRTGQHSHSIGVDENNDRVAVANGVSNTVTIIDEGGAATSVNVGKLPTSPVFSSDGTKLYVTNAQSNTVSVIGTGPEDYWPSVGKTINTQFWPLQAALNPNTGKLYVSNRLEGTVQIIDTATDSVTGSVKVGEEPIDVAVNADTNTVYVANSKSNSVSVLDGATTRVRATVPTNGNYPLGIAVTDAKTAYVTNKGSNNINKLTDPGPDSGETGQAA